MSQSDTARRALTKAALGSWRDSLVNLTGTNRMINFSVRGSALAIQGMEAASLLRWLIDEKTLWFNPASPEPAREDGDPDDDTSEVDELVAASVAISSTLADIRIDIDKPPKELGRILRALRAHANSQWLDKGVPTLHVAIGMLRWSDVDGTWLTSPLLLQPVDLIAELPRQQPYMRAGEDDLILNPALALRLQEFAVSLPRPAPSDDLDVNRYFADVRQAVSHQAGWTVEESLTLANFSFHKAAMYLDLTENEEQILGHPIVAALANTGRNEQADSLAFEPISEDRIDLDAPPEETLLVRDADASQRVCVAAAVAGKSFVMDGPPGTGKSQTIANMIAGLLHAGRTVLFVSEKAAALDVVRKRLGEVGLAPYLLELHSAKATRREVATALGNALREKPLPPKILPSLEVNKARDRRTALSDYAAAMNTVRQPLDMSLHEVLGLLAQASSLPVAPSPALEAERFSARDLSTAREQLTALGRAWRPAQQGLSFTWRSVVDRKSPQARLYAAQTALETLEAVLRPSHDLATATGLDTSSRLPRLVALLDHVGTRPADVPDAWLCKPVADTSSIFDTCVDAIAAVKKAEASLGDFGIAVDALPSSRPWRDLAEALDLLPGTHKPTLDDLGATELAGLSQVLRTHAADLQEVINCLANYSRRWAVGRPETVADAGPLLQLAEVGFQAIGVERHWLNSPDLSSVYSARLILQASGKALAEAQERAEQTFLPACLDTDIESLHSRLQDGSGLKRLSADYRRDRRTVAELLRPGTGLDEGVERLPDAIAWAKASTARRAAVATYGPVLGKRYTGRDVDWPAVDRALVAARNIVDTMDPQVHPLLADHLSSMEQDSAGLAECLRARHALGAWSSTLSGTPSLAACGSLIESPLRDCVAWADSLSTICSRAAKALEALDKVLPTPQTVLSATAVGAAADGIAEAHLALEQVGPQAHIDLGPLWQSMATDLAALTAAVDWSSRLHEICDLPPGLPEQAAHLVAKASPSPRLAEAVHQWVTAAAAIVEMFDAARQSEIRAELDPLDAASHLLTDLANDASGQDEWHAYQDARQGLLRLGLGDAIEFCVKERIDPEQVPHVVERALLAGWADHFLATTTALRPTRAEDRAALVDEFRELDRSLVTSAAAQVIVAVNSRRPTSTIGQAGVIRHEAGKQRKHMPVRTLLERTQQVTQALKPCFMMSPLAVSQYLAPAMHFDVVIFDEASQVTPADAMNCIYRADALITAGDDKQLPPTNFGFTGGADSDDSDEWSEEEPDSKDFESILDLAKASGAVPNLRLRWHYRSRHEDLITFSNVSFYKSDLITFPSSTTRNEDLGVAFFHVPDGRYRRGESARDNPVEAEFVAQRVIHHFRTRPHLTLGVIAFSQSQADAIQHAVERAQVSNPDLDRHFVEDRLDGFFVKNLESVQGDERDVLIFSIGYGKDATGAFTMNLGPLTRARGWRRLNVAVTRARCRNEIVASITASDIKSTTQSEGARHLRRYLDYAERGPASLDLGLDTGGLPESPFEESVIDTIRSWGYQVVSQVGARGFRIDIGVLHPERDGVYVMGVECDGYAYHSSRAARDRDRIREQVLVGLHWNLHRIWGTAWYRNRKAEEARLKAAIQAAVLAPVRGLMGGAPPELLVEPAIFATVEESLDEAPVWAEPYQVATVPPLPRFADPSDVESRFYMAPLLERLVQTEGPIHFDVLSKRVREAWDIGRVGTNIRQNIMGALHQVSMVWEGDFVDVPGHAPTVVRTPTPGCARKSDQIADAEITLAMANYVRDSGGVSQAALTTAVARLFGWGRKGSDISERLDGLCNRLLREGRFHGDPACLSLPKQGTG